MHGRTAISLRWPSASLLDSLNKRASFFVFGKVRLPFRKCISRESDSIKTNENANLTSLALANVRYSRQVQLRTETQLQDRKRSKTTREIEKMHWLGCRCPKSYKSQQKKNLQVFLLNT